MAAQRQLLGLTPRLERFESIVDDVEKRGQTAIFSAIVSAAAALEPVAASSPEVDLRILVLSDGQNNSGHSARDALHAAHDGAVQAEASEVLARVGRAHLVLLPHMYIYT